MASYTLKQSNKFYKDLEKCKRKNLDLVKLNLIVELLVNSKKLPYRSKDHSLKGDYVSLRECHIEPDWLLIYRVKDNVVYLYRTGSHSDLF